MNFFKRIFQQQKSTQPIEKTDSDKGYEIQSEHNEDKPRENTKTFKTKVAGVTFAKRQSYLKRIAKKLDDFDYDFPDISLEREPNNKHDRNAIKVIWHDYNERTDEEKDIHVGYIAAHVAVSLAKDIDSGLNVSAYFEEILGGFDDEDNYGMLITVQIDR